MLYPACLVLNGQLLQERLDGTTHAAEALGYPWAITPKTSEKVNQLISRSITHTKDSVTSDKQFHAMLIAVSHSSSSFFLSMFPYLLRQTVVFV